MNTKTVMALIVLAITEKSLNFELGGKKHLVTRDSSLHFDEMKRILKSYKSLAHQDREAMLNGEDRKTAQMEELVEKLAVLVEDKVMGNRDGFSLVENHLALPNAKDKTKVWMVPGPAERLFLHNESVGIALSNHLRFAYELQAMETEAPVAFEAIIEFIDGQMRQVESGKKTMPDIEISRHGLCATYKVGVRISKESLKNKLGEDKRVADYCIAINPDRPIVNEGESDDFHTLLNAKVRVSHYDEFTGDYLGTSEEYTSDAALTGPIYGFNEYPKGTSLNGKDCGATIYALGAVTQIWSEARKHLSPNNTHGIYTGDSFTAAGYASTDEKAYLEAIPRGGSLFMRTVWSPRDVVRSAGGMLVVSRVYVSHVLAGVNCHSNVAPIKNTQFFIDMLADENDARYKAMIDAAEAKMEATNAYVETLTKA